MSYNGGAVGVSSASYELTESTIKSIEKDSNSTSQNTSIHEEHGEVKQAEVIKVDNVDSAEDDGTGLLSHEEPFPIDPNEVHEEQQFTVRAVVVGCILGGIIAASKYVSPRTPDVHADSLAVSTLV